MNRVLIRPILKKTPYELFNERKPNISNLKVFGCSCFFLNNGKESLMRKLTLAFSLVILSQAMHIKSTTKD